ncbi:MAG TPA: lipoprotein insertase outer membrane protein LolB [Gammaproteobacteria bacterium]|nr:lipoprotein insertase outer membrane protein LolB [Gammaproteobacteria bacterium]
MNIRAGSFLAALLFSGCAAVPETPRPAVSPEQAMELREQRIEAIRHWICVGRVGATNGKDSLSASMRWVQNRDGYQIRLSGPLGQGLVDVRGSASGVALRTGEGGPFFASSPEVLLDEQFGWRLPVSGMRYWILGLPVPEAEVLSRELDVYGRIRRLEQSGWRIEYLDYVQVDGVDLPSRLDLRHPRLSARVAVRRWQLQS